MLEEVAESNSGQVDHSLVDMLMCFYARKLPASIGLSMRVRDQYLRPELGVLGEKSGTRPTASLRNAYRYTHIFGHLTALYHCHRQSTLTML